MIISVSCCVNDSDLGARIPSCSNPNQRTDMWVMDRHRRIVNKPSEAMKRTMVCNQYTTSHFVIPHSLFPSGSNSSLEMLLVQHNVAEHLQGG